nr:retrotransposon protein, putative, Ty1-copia subclass [Tanacetum cinerariifolium]
VSDYDNPDPVPQRQDVFSSADADVPSQQELNLLFGPLYDEFFNAGFNPSKNIQSTSAPSTHTNVHTEENNDDQAEEGKQLQDDEFTNPFCALAQEEAKSSSHNIDPEMCTFALTMSTVESKNIKEAMADSTWIEAMQEELHQFNRLQQAPRAWYDELSKFLISKGFTKGLQIHQCPSGIFINQAKHTLEILHKHGMDKGQSIGTPMATKPKLDVDLSGNLVDQTDYRSKIGSLMYLTSSRPDIVQANYTAMSSAEAEYMALSVSYAQVMWMRIQLQDYGFKYNKIPMYSLPEDRFKYLVRRIGMRCLTPAELEVLAKETA